MKKIELSDVQHIPGENGLPILGEFFRFTGDTIPYFIDQRETHGDLFYAKNPTGLTVNSTDPANNKRILVEGSKQISNTGAWEPALGRLFPNGLMLMDGERHQTHRSIILEAFKPTPMQGYLDTLPAIVAEDLATLHTDTQIPLLPFFKQMTLRIAAQVFFGFDLRDDLTEINDAITAIVDASTSLPIDMPLTKFRRGIEGRAKLVSYFEEALPARRANLGTDLFSRLCAAENEDGIRLTDDEIIDHLIFILMAAHDTTAISLTWMSYFLASHPAWQAAVRVEAIGRPAATDLTVSHIRKLEKTSLVLKETLRLHPPLILVPRQLTADMTLNGHTVPAGTIVRVLLQLTHTDERVWDNPDQFDPERFNAERKEQARCPFSYMPFGAGNHHCIGYAFAEMSIKYAIGELVKGFALSLPADYEMTARAVPFKQPKDGLPILLQSLGQ